MNAFCEDLVFNKKVFITSWGFDTLIEVAEAYGWENPYPTSVFEGEWNYAQADDTEEQCTDLLKENGFTFRPFTDKEEEEFYKSFR